MTPVAKRGLLVTGGFIILLVVVSLVFVRFSSAGARGVAIGAALGIVNLFAGLFFTRRSMRHGIKSTTATIAGGFGARLVVLVALFLAFRGSSTVDAAAFGLTFVAFFFVYLATEIVMIERHRAPEPA